jgi:hypothetical protein
MGILLSLSIVSRGVPYLVTLSFGTLPGLNRDQPLRLWPLDRILRIHAHSPDFPKLAKRGQQTGRQAQMIPVPLCTVVHSDVLENEG